jgi:hypothetical protein
MGVRFTNAFHQSDSVPAWEVAVTLNNSAITISFLIGSLLECFA